MVAPADPGRGRPSVLVVTGTGTDVGKTVVTAAVAALAGGSVAVVKPAQTGVAAAEPGDLAEVERLAGPVTAVELGRYPEPLAPGTAARRAGLPPVAPAAVVAEVERLAADHDLVLVEGAGGLLVSFDEAGGTIADVASGLDAPVLSVARAGLGTLNEVALTAEALAARDLTCCGVMIGSWPDEPDLAARCNLADLPGAGGAPLLGALPAGAGSGDRQRFARAARCGLAPSLGGTFDAAQFRAAQFRAVQGT